MNLSYDLRKSSGPGILLWCGGMCYPLEQRKTGSNGNPV